MITDQQVNVLRRRLRRGCSQEAAAAAAGMSVRSAGKWTKGTLPSGKPARRYWRSRPDPFEQVWESKIVPLLELDTKRRLEATTILEHLQSKDPDLYDDAKLRTLQRRVRDWRAVQGPPKEVFFEQVHELGREAAGDFTHCADLGVTISSEPFDHLLFDLVLSASSRTGTMIAYSESYEALAAGLERALGLIGGVAKVLRLDNLSAATHDLRKQRGRAINERFKGVLEHFGMELSLITPCRPHENGVVEKRNHRLKRVLEQALILRGSRDFRVITEYEAFVDEVVERRLNRPNQAKFEAERPHLRPLPMAPLVCYTTWQVKVRKWSTIRVNAKAYSVPSRLIGHTVTVHQHHDHLEVYYAGRLVESLPRAHGKDAQVIEYRHVIDSLVRKPGAFRRYRYREELFPTLVFRRAYDRLLELHGDRADVEYVRILHLAARTMESKVAKALGDLLTGQESFDYKIVQGHVEPPAISVPVIKIPAPNPAAYDCLLRVSVGAR